MTTMQPKPGRLSHRVVLGAVLVNTLSATMAYAQSLQQTVSVMQGGSTQSQTSTFSSNSPSTNAVIQGSAFNNTNATATSIITQGGSTVASFSSPANNRAVIVTIPSLNISQIFSGGTRTANYTQALAFAEQRAPGLFVSVQSNAAPTNTQNIAVGNPTALVPTMATQGFRVSTGIGQFDPNLPPQAGVVRTPSPLTTGGEVTYGAASGTEFWALTVPLNYKFYFSDPRYSITIDAPLTFLRFGNANVGLGSVGATLKAPIAENWSLGFGVRGGAVGSETLRLGATSYSSTVSSEYNIYFGDSKVTIGNAVGFQKTSGFRVNGGESGPSISNVPISNGVSLEGSLPFTMFDRPASYEAYVVDTYFAGQAIAIRHYDEIGVNIGTRSVIGEQGWNQARFGAAVTLGKSFQAGSLRFSYRF